jgi:ribosomal protein S18 acetylase RimI-like enzyme/glutaredoxin
VSLQLVTRRGCHLCQEAERILSSRGVAFAVLDVDQDAELSRLYDFRVPVLLQDGRPLAEGKLDEAAIDRALGRVRAVLIQAARADSALEVHRLTQLAFGGYGWLTPPSGALAETEDDVRRDLQLRGGALARMAGAAVGALRLRFEPKALWVRRVAVDPAHQGHGVGRELMRWAEQQAAEQGLAEVRLGVREQLPGNRAFYEKLGYRVIQEHLRPGTNQVHWFEMSRSAGGTGE